jgi:hypothetical protein
MEMVGGMLVVATLPGRAYRMDSGAQGACGRVLLAATLLAWALQPLVAQVGVTGRTVDETGAPLAGARVEFRSPLDPKPVVVVSDGQGRFRLELATAGERTLRAERGGFFVLERAVVALHDGPNVVTVTLNHLREVVESVNVVYSPPAVDPVETADQKRLSSVAVLAVPYPASQDYRSALPMFSGVVQDTRGEVHFNGGASDQTNYTLNGFDISDVYTGTLEARISMEAVRSLDLETSRFSVENGRGSSGALDVVTGSGDDRWRFGVTSFLPGVSAERGLLVNKWTPRVAVSGPLRRGRAWFHEGLDTFYDVDTIHELPVGQDRSRSLTTSSLSRLRVNLTPSILIAGSFLLNYGDTDHQGLSFLNPLEATLHRRRALYMGVVRNQAYLPGRTLLETGFAVTRGVVRDSPQGDRTFEITPSGYRGNNFVNLARHTRREEWSADVFLPPVVAGGAHEFKLGADVQRAGFEQSNPRHDYRVLREDGTLARAARFEGAGARGKTDFSAALYLQDRWKVREGLVLELGLRGDWDQAARDTLASPRVSAAWSPAWLRGAKISAGVGVFNDAPSLRTLTMHQDQTNVSTFYSRTGSVNRGPVETLFLADERSLRVPRARILSISLEHMLPRGLYAKVGYTKKAGWDGFTFVAGETPYPRERVTYTLRNQRSDRYDALELTLRRTFAGQFEWAASYTLSSARANAVVDYTLENIATGPQAGGPLDWDTPHRLLTWGWAPVPTGYGPVLLRRLLRELSAAWLVEARRGFPFSVVNEEGFRVGLPNQRRLPSYFNVNLHFEKKFRLLRCLWGWRFGLNNLTNHGNPNVVNNNMDSPFFLRYERGQHRAFNVRLRFLGRR